MNLLNLMVGFDSGPFYSRTEDNKAPVPDCNYPTHQKKFSALFCYHYRTIEKCLDFPQHVDKNDTFFDEIEDLEKSRQIWKGFIDFQGTRRCFFCASEKPEKPRKM